MTNNVLDKIKPLTNAQYDTAKNAAIERTKKRIGNRPSRRQFEREYGALATPQEWIALVVFMAAFVVSSIHIISYIGGLAANSFSSQTPVEHGIVIGESPYVMAHQIAFVLLAEFSMLLFTIMFNLSRDDWRRWIYLLLAGAATIFIVVANLSSHVGIFGSLLPPIFTVGVGFTAEKLIVRWLQRNAETQERYTRAMDTYEAATADITKHPEYRTMLKQSIWEKLMSLKVNSAFADVEPSVKAAAVARETQRDLWAYEADDMPIYGNGVSTSESPLSLPMMRSQN